MVFKDQEVEITYQFLVQACYNVSLTDQIHRRITVEVFLFISLRPI